MSFIIAILAPLLIDKRDYPKVPTRYVDICFNCNTAEAVRKLK